jgi:hypothetical protein
MLKLNSVNQVVDELIERVCIQLSITSTQHARATSAYEAIGKWIADEASPLFAYSPVVFPQGSIPLGTTVRPRQTEDFDADGVCLLKTTTYGITPQQAYDLVLNRIREHEAYRDKVNPQDRCVRVEYEGQLHLDVIPAVQGNDTSNPNLIFIPSHDRLRWQSTNPKGYQIWFATRQALRRRTREMALAEKRAEVQPMPDNGDPEERTPLQRISQLFKRRRDVYFNGDKRAPKSILLTTLAGTIYSGEELATDGAIAVLDSLVSQLENSMTVPKVVNPSNPAENLARHWAEDRKNYIAFLEFVKDFQAQMKALLAQRGTQNIAAKLQEMFDPTGTGFVKKAVEEFTANLQSNRNNGFLKIGATGLTTSTVATKIIPPTKFYGIR